jgi:Protein of unknown function (DUF2384)
MQDSPDGTTADSRDQALARKAAARVAQLLDLDEAVLSRILAPSSPACDDPAAAGPRDAAAFENALDFIRLYRLLDNLTRSDEAARAWIHNDNLALGASPLERLRQVGGLADVLAYLNARQAGR